MELQERDCVLASDLFKATQQLSAEKEEGGKKWRMEAKQRPTQEGNCCATSISPWFEWRVLVIGLHCAFSCPFLTLSSAPPRAKGGNDSDAPPSNGWPSESPHTLQRGRWLQGPRSGRWILAAETFWLSGFVLITCSFQHCSFVPELMPPYESGRKLRCLIYRRSSKTVVTVLTCPCDRYLV